ncbi:MAG: hypothetical protein GZ090_05095 [Oxalobacteraceae bacterium]|nr:hypothetical protein [Oxalobacteraceae bacterium]
MTIQSTPMAPRVVFSGDLVAAHIDGQQSAARFVRMLGCCLSRGDELCDLLAIDAMDISPERRAYLNGLLRQIQTNLELGGVQ